MQNYLPTEFQSFIHLSRYARWIPEKNRRETWEETVARYFDFFEEHLKETCEYTLSKPLRKELEDAILNLQIMPSMRALMTAGKALKRDQIAGFNCAFTVIDNPRAFDEILYVLMCGSGVGFSVERQHINKLPTVAEEFYETKTTISVEDSRIGWAKALKELVCLLYSGQVPGFDLSKIRPAGTPLKIFGGRASGPQPLSDLFDFCVKIFKNAAGRKLTSVECHDLVCKIAECVVVGGVRRSALISLSNLSDDRMRNAKTGKWWETNPQRALANNSASYTERPDMGIFMDEWKSLYDSKSGERGIYNLGGAKKYAAKIGRRDPEPLQGCNPCAEIVLRSKETCNLSEVILKESDTLDDIKEKIRLATILGTFQATLTKYRYLTKEWQKNNEEERLLGVSLTGIMDHPLLNGRKSLKNLESTLEELRQVAINTNKDWAKKLGINQATAISTVKPSGTVSLLCGTSSGIHPRFSPYYVRTVRADNKDPLAKMMKDAGFPWEPDITKPDSTSVFSFPIASPKNAVFVKDVTAIEQLELWMTYKKFWAEHTVSITVYVKENEWLEIAAWVYKNFDDITGVSFLPFTDHNYKQAPYTEIAKEKYDELIVKMPQNVDWSLITKYEEQDHTTSAKEYACGGNGSCELIDIAPVQNKIEPVANIQ